MEKDVDLHRRLFFFNDTATTEIYTLSLHDALPICWRGTGRPRGRPRRPALPRRTSCPRRRRGARHGRSEEHTSELQSHLNLVCRLLLEKKKKTPASIAKVLTEMSMFSTSPLEPLIS